MLLRLRGLLIFNGALPVLYVANRHHGIMLVLRLFLTSGDSQSRLKFHGLDWVRAVSISLRFPRCCGAFMETCLCCRALAEALKYNGTLTALEYVTTSAPH